MSIYFLLFYFYCTLSSYIDKYIRDCKHEPCVNTRFMMTTINRIDLLGKCLINQYGFSRIGLLIRYLMTSGNFRIWGVSKSITRSSSSENGFMCFVPFARYKYPHCIQPKPQYRINEFDGL